MGLSEVSPSERPRDFPQAGLCSIKGALSELRSRAELSVDGRKLLTSGLNVSRAAGRLAGLLSFSPAALNQTRTQHKLDTVLTVQFKGPLRSASLDVHRQDWRFRVAGEAGDWGTRGGTKEARFTLRRTERGEASPAFQVEGWGRLTESLLRASMAVNPELSSSFALIVQGHTSTPSKELMVNVVHSAPQLLPYLPPQLHLRSQLNQSQSNMAALVEVLSGRRKLWALGELAAMEAGYRQTVEVRHSFPQPVPRLVAVSTTYEARRWRHLIQQAIVWGSHQFSLSALHSAAPGLDLEPGNRTLKVYGESTVILLFRCFLLSDHTPLAAHTSVSLSGNDCLVFGSPSVLQFWVWRVGARVNVSAEFLRVQVSGLPRLSSVELVHESSSHSRLDSVLLGWKRQGHLEQYHCAARLHAVGQKNSHARGAGLSRTLNVLVLSWSRNITKSLKVRILRSWNLTEETNETKLELKHPFCSALSQLSLHTLSLRSPRKSSSRLQTHLSWDGAVPVNISLTLNKLSSSVGRACVRLSARQMAVSSGKGCVSMGYRGNLYSQTAELTWHNKSFRQGMTYQKSLEGLHGLQLYMDLDRVSPAPCHSHMLLAKVQTNLRDLLEHRVELGVCPEQPTLWWSGSHRLNSGEKLFYSQCNVSMTGQPLRSRFTLALTNSSTAQGSNISLYTEKSSQRFWRVFVSPCKSVRPAVSLEPERGSPSNKSEQLRPGCQTPDLESVVGNWSLLLGSSGLSGPHGASLQVHATLGRRHQVWVNGTLGGRCLRTAAGYMNGEQRITANRVQKTKKSPGLCEDISAAVCAGMNHSFKAEVQRRERCRETETLGSWSLQTANQRLMMSASGCLERLTAVEVTPTSSDVIQHGAASLCLLLFIVSQERFHFLSSEIQKELLERRKELQHLLTETTEQPADMRLLQDWISIPLLVSQHAEGLLGRGSTGLLSLWLSSSLRRALTSSLPDLLRRLQQASLQGQQELRRPLATLAGVYQDVKGQRLEAAWREAVGMLTGRLLDVLPAELENPHLRALAAAGASALTAALDVAGQQSSHWTEARLATALSGLRKRLASLYTFSRRYCITQARLEPPSVPDSRKLDCAVALSVPLPSLDLSRAAEGELLETVLEEWLLGPLRALASIRPAAELYRFKRRIMDSPFRHQALLVADQFVVTFDGRLYELPVSCPLLLAQDVRSQPSFTLLLGADAQSSLLILMDNSRVHIPLTGQAKADCRNAVPHGPLSSRGLSVTKGSNKVQVSNQEGQSVSCDLQLELCSFTLDGWLHGASAGLLGTNDNDAANDLSLRDGSQAKTPEEFFHSWELEPKCNKSADVSTAAASPASCASFFSSPDSPLSSCFRVVDPAQFLSVCGRSSSKAPCRLAAAFVHLCQQNYVPVEIPGQCVKV
ncbi:hypothetical protein CCH79_00011232 [Gambusia affinis]|uniref:VWFD domain-containing protein n=1 Tax=Gambusia affinis TaxID=33528 RepID=A0A315V1U5_GAMAF|nr:hypothetical protein CCH79_00011232 [Gambusia affinis]